MRIDTCTGSERVKLSWQFESLLWDISSGFPLSNHPALPGSESVFSVVQGPPMCAHISLGQGGF